MTLGVIRRESEDELDFESDPLDHDREQEVGRSGIEYEPSDRSCSGGLQCIALCGKIRKQYLLSILFLTLQMNVRCNERTKIALNLLSHAPTQSRSTTIQWEVLTRQMLSARYILVVDVQRYGGISSTFFLTFAL